jgi:hypothetical protein
MIEINQLRLSSAQPRVAQSDRYAAAQFPTATNWYKQEVRS